MTNGSEISDPFEEPSVEFFQNPYVFYSDLREKAPVLWNERRRWWVVTKYKDVAFCLRDPRLSRQYKTPLQRLLRPFPPLYRLHGQLKGLLLERGATIGKWMVFKDNPDHARLRSAAVSVLTPERLKGLEDFIETLCRELLKKQKHAETFDLVEQYSDKIPCAVTAKLFGLPSESVIEIEPMCRNATFLLGAGKIAHATQELCRISEYLQTQTKTISDTGGVASEFMKLVANKTITYDEAIANLTLMIIARFEPIGPLIATGTLLLLSHPEQLELLQKDSEMMPGAIEEILRFEPPVQIVQLIVDEPVEVGGKRLKVGDDVKAVIGSANRDPDAFENPDKFDITRGKRSHLAFGTGPYYCVGAQMGRMEASIALKVLFEFSPSLRLASTDLKYGMRLRPRGLESLPVTT